MRGTSRVWRALDRARAMNLTAAGEPPSARASGGLSRRQVMAALAGGLGAAAFPRWPAQARATQRVAIVGGGLAGLSALDTLRAGGAEAMLYEARAATGGRTRSVRGVFAPDYAFDEGAQLVNSDQADLLRLVRRFGLTLVDRRAFGPSHEIQIGRSGADVAEEQLARSLRAIAARITADSDRLDADYSNVSREIDALSVAQYLDRNGLAEGDGRDAIEATIRTEYGVEPTDASAIELLFNLPTVDGRRVTRIGTSDERYLISGGTGQVAQALAAEHAEHIRLGRRLVRLDMTGEVLWLGFADGSTVEADRVILALPAPLLREIRFDGPLPPLWRQLIDEVQLGRNEKVIVGYDTQPWRRRIGFAGSVWAARDFSAIWDAASIAPAAGAGALCYFLGGDQVANVAEVPAAELASRFSTAARRVLPDLPEPNGGVRRTRWCDDPMSRGAYVNYRPGQLTRFGSLMTVEEDGAARASQAGRLLFAGEWLSDAWPGFMNGAIQTGRVAAQTALAPAEAMAA